MLKLEHSKPRSSRFFKMTLKASLEGLLHSPILPFRADEMQPCTVEDNL